MEFGCLDRLVGPRNVRNKLLYSPLTMLKMFLQVSGNMDWIPTVSWSWCNVLQILPKFFYPNKKMHIYVCFHSLTLCQY